MLDHANGFEGNLARRTIKIVTVLGLLVGLSACVAVGQQAGSAAPSLPADAAPALAKVYDVGPEVTAPELLPIEWAIPAEKCKEKNDGAILLLFLVDANGVPQEITVPNTQDNAREKLAIKIVGRDRFKPASLRGEPVAVSQWVEMIIDGCFASRQEDAGTAQDVFRLTAPPVQKFGPLPLRRKTGRKKSLRAEGSGAALDLYSVGEGASAPVPLNAVEAEYTEEAKHKRISGVCVISLIVGADGMPLNPRVNRSLEPGLDRKAIEAVNKYQFKPAMKKGVPVPVMITVAVNFRLY